MMNKTVTFLAAVLLCFGASAQDRNSDRNSDQRPASNNPQMSSSVAVPYSSLNQVNALLAQLESAAQSATTDVAKLRIEKWKADSGTKQQMQGNADSILRNLQSALPGLIADVRTAPENLLFSFKLYRNLDALYDVLGSVAESAGAFGSKNDYQALSEDLDSIERVRRDFADRMENLATIRENEAARLRAQVRSGQGTASSGSAKNKKVIIDDTEPEKKPAHKKKTPKPAANPNQNTSNSNLQSATPQ